MTRIGRRSGYQPLHGADGTPAAPTPRSPRMSGARLGWRKIKRKMHLSRLRAGSRAARAAREETRRALVETGGETSETQATPTRERRPERTLRKSFRSARKGLTKRAKRLVRGESTRSSSLNRSLGRSLENLASASSGRAALSRPSIVRRLVRIVRHPFQHTHASDTERGHRRRRHRRSRPPAFVDNNAVAVLRILNQPGARRHIGDMALAPLSDWRAMLEGMRLQSAAAPDFPWREECDILSDAGDYAAELELAAQRLETLERKKEAGALTPAEAHEFTQLLAQHKEALGVAQRWLSNMPVRHVANANARARQVDMPLLMLAQSMAVRLSRYHMAVADMSCRHKSLAPGGVALSAVDRLHHNGLQVEGALNALRALRPPGQSAAFDEVIAEVEAHRERLSDALEAHRASDDGGRLRARLADAPLAGPATPEERAEAVARLEGRWTGIAQNRRPPPSLPMSNPVLTQGEMIEAFARFQLARSGEAALLPAAEEMSGRMTQGVHEAVEAAPWEPIAASVPMRADAVEAGEAVFTSGIQPAGGGVAQYFDRRYDANGISAPHTSEHRHVRNLARTVLHDAEGACLFEALRHGVADPYGITPDALAAMPVRALERLLSEAYWRDGMARAQTPDANALARAIQLGQVPAARVADIARTIRTNAAETMARELAVAALAMDAAKYKDALDGKVVPLSLNTLSLVETPAKLETQRAGLRALADAPQPVVLVVRDLGGLRREVRVDIRLRDINLSVDEARQTGRGLKDVPLLRRLSYWGYAARQNEPALRSLLGARPARAAGGAAGAALGRLTTRIAEVHREKDSMLAEGVPQDDERIAALETEIKTLDDKMRVLLDCANQIKTIWRTGAYRSAGHEPFKMVSRLALLCHLIGEPALLSDTDGLDAVGYLDAEAKYLAARGRLDRRLPAPDTPPDDRTRLARTRFAFGGGNLELQRMNRGLPGYEFEHRGQAKLMGGA